MNRFCYVMNEVENKYFLFIYFIYFIPQSRPSFSTFRFLFAISSRVFAVEQFRIGHWKANEKTNLMI